MRVVTLIGACALAINVWGMNAFAKEPAAAEQTAIVQPRSLDEARSRAKLLFEMTNGSLQVMHRDFFDDEDPSRIPSASLEDVFKQMKETYEVELKWLNAGTDPLNLDHLPKGEFEQRAAAAMKSGQAFVEESSEGEYRYVGSVTLRSQCLKCHVKNRTSTDDRYAGLVIRMPLERNK